jgi:hypothetical protein
MNKVLIWVVLWPLSCAVGFAQDLSARPNPKHAENKATPVMAPASQRLLSRFSLNGGLHTEFFNSVQDDESGHLRRFDTAPVIGITALLPASPLEFLPEINWVLPRRAGANVLKNIFMLRGDLGYSPVDWFRLRAGSSLMWLNQHGSGGTEKINNGNSTTTFYYPDENRSALNNTLDLGAEFLMNEWGLRLQSYIYSAFKEERRQISYTLFLSYYWGR